MITLGAKDLQAVSSFYEHVFGFRVESRNDNITFFDLRGSWLGVYGLDALAEDIGIENNHKGFGGFTLAHNLESEEAVDALFKHLTENGATAIKTPQKVFWGGYSSYIADPEYNYWEIAYNPFGWIGPERDASAQ